MVQACRRSVRVAGAASTISAFTRVFYAFVMRCRTGTVTDFGGPGSAMQRAAASRPGQEAGLAALLDGLDGLSEQGAHLGADFRLANTLGREVLDHFAHHVVVAALLEVGEHDLLGVGVGVGAALAEDAGGP